MNADLDYKFLQWLSKIANDWGISVEDFADQLARNEIEDREKSYSKISLILSQSNFDLDSLLEVAQESWPLGGRFVLIRLSEFLKNQQRSKRIIQKLIKNFPETDNGAIKRIDDFIEDAVSNGYVNAKNMPDRSGAALLSSVILTSLFPDRFVDFRISRWGEFYKIFNDDIPFQENDTYGERIVWASSFAKDLARTNTFKKYWSDEPALWVISSFAWVGPSPNREFLPEEFDDESGISFPEGKWKERLHKYRERNSKVIKKAKTLRLKKDPLLKCDVCGFSFVHRYGVRGKHFIEAHHTIPLESLTPGDETKIEDIALVCSNCHSMIHRGENTLDILELRNLLN